jgi:hypothetical protein
MEHAAGGGVMEGEEELRREAEGGGMIEEEEEEEVEEFYIPLEFVDYQGTNLLQTFKNYSLIVRRGPHSSSACAPSSVHPRSAVSLDASRWQGTRVVC